MKKNFLIVDDCPIMRLVIKKTILMSELEVNEIKEAENGKKGLEMLKKQDFDLVVVDLNMPVMSGAEMVGHMRTDSKLQHIPVLTVSAESNSNKVEVLSHLVDGFVHKPFSSEILKNQLLKVLRNQAIITSDC